MRFQVYTDETGRDVRRFQIDASGDDSDGDRLFLHKLHKAMYCGWQVAISDPSSLDELGNFTDTFIYESGGFDGEPRSFSWKPEQKVIEVVTKQPSGSVFYPMLCVALAMLISFVAGLKAAPYVQP